MACPEIYVIFYYIHVFSVVDRVVITPPHPAIPALGVLWYGVTFTFVAEHKHRRAEATFPEVT